MNINCHLITVLSAMCLSPQLGAAQPDAKSIFDKSLKNRSQVQSGRIELRSVVTTKEVGSPEYAKAKLAPPECSDQNWKSAHLSRTSRAR